MKKRIIMAYLLASGIAVTSSAFVSAQDEESILGETAEQEQSAGYEEADEVSYEEENTVASEDSGQSSAELLITDISDIVSEGKVTSVHAGESLTDVLEKEAEEAAPVFTDTFVPAPISRLALGDNAANMTKIYRYLTEEMELNDAAACGVMTNIRLETGAGFTANHRQASYGVVGSNGTAFGTYSDSAGYGLCQWTSAGRKKNLYYWCQENVGSGSYGTIEGQLQFMEYEMKHGYGLKGYQNFYDFLKEGIENTAQGAYDAAYGMCFAYEMPRYYNIPYGSYKSESDYRGCFSSERYWPLLGEKGGSIEKLTGTVYGRSIAENLSAGTALLEDSSYVGALSESEEETEAVSEGITEEQ